MTHKLTNNHRQPSNIILLLSKLTNTTILSTITQKIEKEKNELSENISQPNLSLKNVIDFLKVLVDEKKSAIVYFLIENDVCYQNGLRKVFPLLLKNKLTIENCLTSLRGAGIIEEVPKEDYKKEEEIKSLSYHKKVFGLSDYHFNKVVFYRLTPPAKEYFSRIDWDKILSKKTIQEVQHYKKLLASRTHSNISNTTQNNKLQTSPQKENSIYDEYEMLVREFINKLHQKFIQIMGEEYEKYRRWWYDMRQKIKIVYTAKLKGNEWKKLARAKFPNQSEFIINCIEKGTLDIEDLVWIKKF